MPSAIPGSGWFSLTGLSGNCIGPLQNPVVFIDRNVDLLARFYCIHPFFMTVVIHVRLTKYDIVEYSGFIFIDCIDNIILQQVVTPTVGEKR